jgi:hypothetical protein
MVKRLVSTVSFSILFNGDRLESFKPSRGTYPSIASVIQSLPISSCWQQRPTSSTLGWWLLPLSLLHC